MKKLSYRQKYKFSFLFILLSLAIIFFDSITNFLIYFLVVAIHELSHYFVAKKLGYKLSGFYIMPYGACLNYENNIFYGNDEIYISLAGPLSNLLLCVICVALWWLFPETYYYLDYFCFCNLLLGLFNILPCFPMDGGRALTAILAKSLTREKAIKICVILNYVICIILTGMFVISFLWGINLSFLFLAIFIFSGTINPHKYTNYQYLSLNINRKEITQKGCGVKIFAVAGDMPLYKILAKFTKYKFNIVYVITKGGNVRVLSEININNLAVKHSLSTCIDEIVMLKKYNC